MSAKRPAAPPTTRGTTSAQVRRALPIALASAMLCLAGPARAHVGPPRAVGIHVSPADPDHLVFRTTFGMVMTRDGGDSFDWICGAGVGFEANFELPQAAIFSDGSMTSATFNGMRISSDGCNWDDIAGEAAGVYFRQVIQEQGADQAVALRTNGIGAFQFEVDLWLTEDGGVQWERLGLPPPADFLAYGVGQSRSDADRLYLTGQDGPENARTEVVMRSDDGGATWQRLALPSTDPAAITSIAAIDANNPDIVYVASAVLGEVSQFRLHRSVDGTTFEEVANWPARVSSVALSPDGSVLAVGAEDTGLWLAPTTAGGMPMAFEPGPITTVHCLTWTDDALYACGDQANDGFAVGRSVDGGASFAPFMQRESPCLLSCDPASDVGEICPAFWATELMEIGDSSCPGAGVGGAGSGGAGVGGGQPPIADDGCDCSQTPGRTIGGGWLLALLAAAAVAVRRTPRPRGKLLQSRR